MTRVGRWQSTALRSWTHTLMVLLLSKQTELPSIRWSDPTNLSSVSGGSGRSSSRCHGWAVDQSGPRDLAPQRLQPKAREDARSSPGSCRVMWTSWAPRAEPYRDHSHRTYWKHRTADLKSPQKNTRIWALNPKWRWSVLHGLSLLPGSHRKTTAESVPVSDLVSPERNQICTSAHPRSVQIWVVSASWFDSVKPLLKLPVLLRLQNSKHICV